MVNEISQSQKDKYCMIPLTCDTKIVKHIETDSRMVVARAEGRGKEELLFNEYKVSALQDN